MFRTVSVLLILALLSFPSFVFAKDKAADNKTVQKLEMLFSDFIKIQEEKIARGGGNLNIDGDILVEKADSYYAVTLPALSVKYADDSAVKIGMISVNVMSTKEPDVWKMTIALPTAIKYYGTSGADSDLTIRFGGQNFAGIWREDINSFSKFNAHYNNIRIESDRLQWNITIPDILAKMNLEKNDKEQWSGIMSYRAKNTSIQGDDGEKFTAKNIQFDIGVQEYDIKAARDYEEQLIALAESYEYDDVPSSSGEHALGVYNLFANAIGNIWNEFSIKISLNEGELVIPSEDKAVSIGNAGITFTTKGYRENDLALGTRIYYNGFSVDPTLPGYENTMPPHMNFDVSINHLPYQELVELGRETLKTLTGNPAMVKIAALQALVTAPQILTDAGTNLKISKSFLNGNGYRLDVNGVATTDIQAVKGATATARVDIFGIDTFLSYMGENIKNPDIDEEKREDIEKNMMSLEMMKLLGIQTTNDDGKFVMRYDFKLTKEGQILLNDRDLVEALADEEE